MMPEGKPARREDALLDKISELRAKRDSALAQMDIWEESAPELADQLDELRLKLL